MKTERYSSRATHCGHYGEDGGFFGPKTGEKISPISWLPVPIHWLPSHRLARGVLYGPSVHSFLSALCADATHWAWRRFGWNVKGDQRSCHHCHQHQEDKSIKGVEGGERRKLGEDKERAANTFFSFSKEKGRQANVFFSFFSESLERSITFFGIWIIYAFLRIPF